MCSQAARLKSCPDKFAYNTHATSKDTVSTSGTPVIFCAACGAHNAPDARFCQTCGQAMSSMQALPASASIAAYASHPYGGFWLRLLAWIIDVIIVDIVLLPLSFALGTAMG